MSTDLNKIRNNRILVIDDNPSIHADIRKILCRPTADTTSLDEDMALLFEEKPVEQAILDFKIDSAFQGQEGLAKVEEARSMDEPYGLAFVDIRMPPGWDGVETIQHIWKSDPDLQVVVCTAYSDYSWEEMFRRIGPSDSLVILKKPFDNIEVLQLAHALTQKWRLNQELKTRLRNLDHLVNQRAAELQTANEQLRQAQKMEAIGQLAAGVAHDFNNILTVIEGNASLLLDTHPPETEDRSNVDAIVNAARRAGKLVRQLLTFSRKQFMQAQPMTIADTLSTVSEMWSRVLGEQIAVKVEAAPNLPLIEADAGMMEQMLMNLAVNARDAMEGGGVLTITAETARVTEEEASKNPDARAGDFLRLAVSDTGCGMSQELLTRIFEPFFTTKPVGKGTGLGLATVYGIVRQHKGWLEVRSELGKGSTFIVFIPASKVYSQAAPGSAPNEAVAGGDESILLVEDEEPVRALVTHVLAASGYEVIPVGTGLEAMEQWGRRGRAIDLLLTDLVMPGGMTGRELAGRLLTEAPGLRVIYTSGYSPGMAGKDVDLLEGRNFLPKPYAPAKLLRMVREVLNQADTDSSAPGAL